jgi:DNA polymerase III delta subunit
MGADISHINIVSAPDNFLIEEVVEHILAQLRTSTVDITTYDYDPQEFGTVLDRLRSHSLFGTKECIVLKSAKNMSPEDQAYVAALPSVHTLIIEVVLKPQEARKKCAALSSYIYSAQGAVYDNQLPQWVQRRFAKLGGKISYDAAQALIGFTGNQLTIINRELDNLLLFVGKAVEVSDVRSLLDRTGESDVFELVDAIALRDRQRAFSSLWRELQSGTSGVAIVALVVGHFLKLLDFKRSNRSPVGFYQEKMARQASAFSRTALEDIILLLTHADRRIKSEAATELILEELIIHILKEGKESYGYAK